jgi:hypothetical protein
MKLVPNARVAALVVAEVRAVDTAAVMVEVADAAAMAEVVAADAVAADVVETAEGMVAGAEETANEDFVWMIVRSRMGAERFSALLFSDCSAHAVAMLFFPENFPGCETSLFISLPLQ